jgi:hypothetical protein
MLASADNSNGFCGLVLGTQAVVVFLFGLNTGSILSAWQSSYIFSVP